MVLRHLSLLSRPSSIEGVEWEDKHEPEIRFDKAVFASCLLFLLICVAMYLVENTLGVFVFIVTTALSTLSDSVYYNHYWLDTADRIQAVISFIFLSHTTFLRWFIYLELEQMFSFPTMLKLMVVVALAGIPVSFLNGSRKNPVRSENWRWFHIRWHIFGSIGGALSTLIGYGWFDSHIHEFVQIIEQNSYPLLRFEL